MSKKRKSIGPVLILCVLVAGAGIWYLKSPRQENTPDPNMPTGPKSALEQERDKLDQTLWAQEVQAQHHESVFVTLWDNLRAATDKSAVLAAFPFTRLILPKALPPETLTAQVRRVPHGTDTLALTHDQFRKAVADLAAQGYVLVQSEWHHSTFESAPDGPARSTISMTLHIENKRLKLQQAIKADLRVSWADAEGSEPVPDTIEVANLKRLERNGSPVFQPMLTIGAPQSPQLSAIANPIIAYDLNRDGLSEVIVAGRNLVLWNDGGGTFRREPISREMPQLLNAALVADFNADTRPDFFAVDIKSRQPYLIEGGDGGRFTGTPKACAEISVILPSVMTAGDIDSDGDLDVFIGQYKPPYAQGQMPTPYYDANDGFPAYLLRNEGGGFFTDITEAAGLAKKRFRRSYGASFVDLNDDGNLDLLVSSDFAGIDLYQGNGQGAFADVTDTWVTERFTFGMSHTFADYDNNGALDFYSVGMSSTTARRLERMGLERKDRVTDETIRRRMSYGNRLYFGGESQYTQPPFNDHVARTGWSWGSTSFDFDNDGDVDIYVANGHQSGRSAKDYCTTFWCHDIYTGQSRPDASVASLFSKTMRDLMNQEISWNGFEHNALLMNRREEGFLNVAFLMGAAYEGDGRSVVSDDLDGDGRVDLLVVENRVLPGSRVEQSLRIVANTFESPHHWIGVRLYEEGPFLSPIGARITLHTREGKRVARIVTGDSIYSQHASTAHFGLGTLDTVIALEVRWPNGTTKRVDHPAIDQYHVISPKP